jgi:hypothetical protein
MKIILPLAALALLSACAGKGNYPSLNPRPIEAKAGALLAEPSSKEAAPLPSSPELARQIAAARSAVQANAPLFDAAIARAQALVDKAGASGSESWIAAQMEVSAAERTRAQIKSALADLDGLLRTLLSGPAGEDLEAARTAIREVETEDAREAAAISALQAALNR